MLLIMMVLHIVNMALRPRTMALVDLRRLFLRGVVRQQMMVTFAARWHSTFFFSFSRSPFPFSVFLSSILTIVSLIIYITATITMSDSTIIALITVRNMARIDGKMVGRREKERKEKKEEKEKKIYLMVAVFPIRYPLHDYWEIESRK
ncbi:hypothetical protein EV426DRAFT_720084 [Tirmania nivea]|nr:hypothetical protein EV426DRAFT_720084 [Tirmania nivea]